MTGHRGEGAREFRVTWQRQGMSRRKTRLLQSEAAARRLARRLQGLVPEGADPNERCCAGYSSGAGEYEECGCGGLTLGERMRRWHARYPPLIFGPRIESRPVGEWEMVSEAEPEDREPWPMDTFGQALHPDAFAEREFERAAQPEDDDGFPF